MTAQPWLSDEGRYEAAVVYPLDERGAALVRETRARFDGSNAAPPHFTLIFLGIMNGSQLGTLADALAEISLPPFDVRIRGGGTFEDNGRFFAHLALERSDDLVAAHRRVHEVCACFSWFAPGPHVVDRWSPHITIAELASAPPSDLTEPLEELAGKTISLSRANLMARRLDPVVVRELTRERE